MEKPAPRSTDFDLVDYLHAHGMRVTPQKIAIFKALQKDNFHPSAERLFAEIRAMYPMTSFGTVYQILEQFSQIGLVRKIWSGENRQRFDGKVEPHAHFVCRECGLIDDVEDKMVDDFARRFDEKYDYVVEKHYFEFSGLCAKCQKKQARSRRRSPTRAGSK